MILSYIIAILRSHRDTFGYFTFPLSHLRPKLKRKKQSLSIITCCCNYYYYDFLCKNGHQDGGYLDIHENNVLNIFQITATTTLLIIDDISASL